MASVTRIRLLVALAFLNACASTCGQRKEEVRPATLSIPGSPHDSYTGDGGGDRKREADDDDTPPHAAKGTTVSPAVSLHWSDDGEPEFDFPGFPALSQDRKTLAYAMSDDDMDLVSALSVVLVDVEKAKVRKTYVITAHSELANYVEKGLHFPKEPWEKRVNDANFALQGSWSAVAYAAGSEQEEEEPNEGYQEPTIVDGVRIGTPDPSRPTWFEASVSTPSPEILFAQDVRAWILGRKRHVAAFDFAADRDAAIAVFRTRAGDEPYLLRITQLRAQVPPTDAGKLQRDP
jgi:hypothetical protein